MRNCTGTYARPEGRSRPERGDTVALPALRKEGGLIRTPDIRFGIVPAAAVAAICAACAAVPVGTPLQSTASAEAPVVAVGDNWTYRVQDAYTGIARPTERFRVTEAGNGRIRVAVSREGVSADETRTFDSQWNWLTHPATHLQAFNYSPAYPAYSFPLAPGKTWRERLTATDPKDGQRFPVWVHGTVLGWERVKVPAGEFDALKIKRTVTLDYLETGWRGSSDITEYEWYAPAVKQSVRRDFTAIYFTFVYGRAGASGPLHLASLNNSGMGYVPDDWLIWELVSHSVR